MIEYNTEAVPFSTRGSWMSLRTITGGPAWAEWARGDGLYLRAHHGRDRELARLVPMRNGDEASCDITATPSSLSLTAEGAGAIDICYETPDSLRLRGKGLALALHVMPRPPKASVYSEAPHLITLNLNPIRRYQIERLRGDIRAIPATDTSPIAVEVSPDPIGCWEIAIDEFWSTWERPSRPAFDDCTASTDRRFADFLATMPPCPAEFDDARALASYVNWSAIVAPCGLVRRPAMLMSKNFMCGVWSWDNCFNAMALASGLPELALDQFFAIADHQDAFGCNPDKMNDTLIQYNFTKPPVHGWAVSSMLERFAEPPGADVVAALYDSLCKQARWWLKHRRLENQSLPHYLHGFDSGWDNATVFDRGVPLIAPDLAAYLVAHMDGLAELASALGRTEDKARWEREADNLCGALIDDLWHGDRFVARLARDGGIVDGDCLLPCMPILLGKRLPEAIRNALKKRTERHLTEWGLATEHPESEHYTPNGYWRGPIWAPPTYLIVCGLERSGFHELAQDIARRFCRLCARSGFAENFDALTGESQSDPAYTWTASVFLLLAQSLTRYTASCAD